MNDTTSSKHVTVTVTTSSGGSISATTPDLINLSVNDAKDEAAIPPTGTIIVGVVVPVALILIVIIIAAVCFCNKHS